MNKNKEYRRVCSECFYYSRYGTQGRCTLKKKSTNPDQTGCFDYVAVWAESWGC